MRNVLKSITLLFGCFILQTQNPVHTSQSCDQKYQEISDLLIGSRAFDLCDVSSSCSNIDISDCLQQIKQEKSGVKTTEGYIIRMKTIDDIKEIQADVASLVGLLNQSDPNTLNAFLDAERRIDLPLEDGKWLPTVMSLRDHAESNIRISDSVFALNYHYILPIADQLSNKKELQEKLYNAGITQDFLSYVSDIAKKRADDRYAYTIIDNKNLEQFNLLCQTIYKPEVRKIVGEKNYEIIDIINERFGILPWFNNMTQIICKLSIEFSTAPDTSDESEASNCE